jgi:phage shock protein B
MFDDLTAVLIVFAGVFMIITLRYLKLKSQTAGRLSAEDATAYEQMAQMAARLETRVATLERILDSEVPAWRDNQSGFYRQASQ